MGFVSDWTNNEEILTKALNQIFEEGGSVEAARFAFSLCMKRIVDYPLNPRLPYCEGPERNPDEYVADKTIYKMAREGTHTAEEIVQGAEKAIDDECAYYKNFPDMVDVTARIDHWVKRGALRLNRDRTVRLRDDLAGVDP